jgi:dienelactone hydrolase
MATLVLFHSALGLRPAVGRLADRLRSLEHTVHTPDLYAGEVFDDLDDGVAHRDALGIPTLMARAMAAVEQLPGDVVYGGLSMGVAPAQLLAATRPGARGAVLMHGGLPPEALAVEAWPASVPVQVHACADDPWIDQEGLEAFVERVPADLVERLTYPGSAHLFTDEDSPDHLPAASEQLFGALVRFLSAQDRAGAAGSPTS